MIVTESYPPDVNGVAHCALHTARHLTRRGHDVLVVAPAPSADTDLPTDDPAPVVHVASLPLPRYPQVRVAWRSRKLAVSLAAHRPDVVHLSSPFVLGARAMNAAARRGIPSVAIYQMDVAGYARAYLGAGQRAACRRIRAIHTAADLILAPSSASVRDLGARGIPRVRLWPRGVDTERFQPDRRDEALRRSLVPDGELLVGVRGPARPGEARWPACRSVRATRCATGCRG